MFISIEEMYDFKAKYEAEIEEIQRKLSVIDEFIAFAEAKEVDKSETTEEVVDFQEEETAVEETAE